MRRKRQQSMKRYITRVVPALLMVGVLACGETEEDPASSGSGSDGDLTDLNSLSSAVPGGLQLAIFPQEEGGAALSLQDPGPGTGPSGNDAELKKSFKEKVQENRERLKGTASECFSAGALAASAQIEMTSCYNFDSDMKVSVKNNAPNDQKYGTTNGTLGGAISGQVGSRDPNEACLVSKARQEVSEVVLRVDQAMAMASGLVCAAKKAQQDKALGVGESLELKDVMNDQLSGKEASIVNASIRRVDDRMGHGFL